MNEDKPSVMPPVPPFVRFVASAVPMVFDDSLSYYEALCALWKYVSGMTDVINNNATLEEEYILKFNELKSFVDNYFNNLDVQEEINNKLDAMVEDGTLQEIITTYIQANVAWTFDTVADMKLSTNLIDGSYARTLGFHTLNDGGGALYYITDSGTADEMSVIAVDELYANLVKENIMCPEMFGAYGDDTHDDAPSIRAGLAFLDSYGGGVLHFSAGKTYKIASLVDPDALITSFFELGNNITICGKGTIKVGANFGDYDNIFRYTSALDNVIVKDITIDDNTSNNPVLSSTGNTENHHRTGFRFISHATKNIVMDNITFKDTVGVWQIIIEQALKAEISNIKVNYNTSETLDYDRTSIYFGALSGSVHDCRLIGGDNGLTAFELHGLDNILYNNYVEGFTTGVYVTNQNIVNEDIKKLEVYSNTFSVERRGISCWLTDNNITADAISIHDNLVNITSTTLSGVIGIGNHDLVGNNSGVKNYDIYNNVINVNNTSCQPFRFAYTQSANVFTIDKLCIKNNKVSGSMQYALYVASQANNTFSIKDIELINNEFNISDATRFIHFIARTGFENCNIKDNNVKSSSLTQFFRIFGTPSMQTVIEGNTCSVQILASDIAGGDDVTGVLVKYDNALLNKTTTFNALPANIKNGSVISSGKFVASKSEGKWIIKCESDVMPKHQWIGKGSVINLSNDTNIIAIAKTVGYLGDHLTSTGDHKVGDWVVHTNNAVWYCKADNNYTDNPSGHTDVFQYIGVLPTFYEVSAS